VFLKHTFLVIAAIINNWMHPVKATQLVLNANGEGVS
jgi:hypothetical protein